LGSTDSVARALPALCAAQAPLSLGYTKMELKRLLTKKNSHVNLLNGIHLTSKHLHSYFGVDSQTAIFALPAVNISRKRNKG
jgi:hypothetical protein